MHIPDNYLSPATCGITAAAMIPVWGHSVKKIGKVLPKDKMPMLGVGAAFSFLAMMFNVPLIGGTTGHAVGGTLIALLFGPEASCIAVSVALLIQAFVFGDGGVLALGANCFNMAFVLPYVGYFAYKLLRKIKCPNLVAAGIGSYLGLNAAAFTTSVMFGIQPLLYKDDAGIPLYCPYDVTVSIPAMMIPHLVVAGLVEAAFTIAVYAYIKKTSPALLLDESAINMDNDKKEKKFPVFALLAVLIAATPLGLLATGTAWGEWEIEGWTFNSPMPDYAFEGMNEIAAYILSAILGTAMLIIFFKLISLLKKDTRNVA